MIIIIKKFFLSNFQGLFPTIKIFKNLLIIIYKKLYRNHNHQNDKYLLLINTKHEKIIYIYNYQSHTMYEFF